MAAPSDPTKFSDRLLKVDDTLIKQIHAEKKFRCLESELIEHERNELDSSVNNDEEDEQSCKGSSVSSDIEDEAKLDNVKLVVQTNFDQTNFLTQKDFESKIVILSPLSDTTKTATTTTREESSEQVHLGNVHQATNSKIKSIIKSSRSNSIDQLIAAAAVTSQPISHSPVCNSPQSPASFLHSPQIVPFTSSSFFSSPIKPQSFSSESNFKASHNDELSVSRKNLNTIVEAIFHVEGKNLLDEFEVTTNNLSANPLNAFYNSSHSSSYYTQNYNGANFKIQPKPPKKRKYTTEDIVLPAPDEQLNHGLHLNKLEAPNEFYTKSQSSTHCENLNNLLLSGNKSLNLFSQSQSLSVGQSSIHPTAIIIINNNPINVANTSAYNSFKMDQNVAGTLTTLDSSSQMMNAVYVTSSENCLQVNPTSTILAMSCENERNENVRNLNSSSSNEAAKSQSDQSKTSASNLFGLLVNS